MHEGYIPNLWRRFWKAWKQKASNTFTELADAKMKIAQGESSLEEISGKKN